MSLLDDILQTALQSVGSTPLGSLSAWIEGFAEYLAQAEKRERVLRILWFVCTVVLIVLTALVVGVLWWTVGWKAASLAGVVLWAVYLGATGLLFLPSRAMTAVFGGMLGVSLSEVSSGAGLIASANKSIAAMAVQIGAIVSPSTQPDPFIGVLVWTFVLITLVLSLPAFFAQDGGTIAQPAVAADAPKEARR